MNESKECSCKFQTATMAAVVFGGLFVIFLFFTPVMVKWWIMLPLAVAAFFLFRMQREATEGLERQICDWGYWAVIAGFLLRDMCLSSRLAGLYEQLPAVAETVRAATRI